MMRNVQRITGLIVRIPPSGSWIGSSLLVLHLAVTTGLT
jgi:hypothetical protein